MIKCRERVVCEAAGRGKGALRRVMQRRRERKPAREAGFFVLAERDCVMAERDFEIRDRERPGGR